MENEKITHPSYGLIRFSRISSNGTTFYGSELEQNNYITLEISNSELERDLITERYYKTYHKPDIIKLRMSAGQFSELITSMNMGQGIPCTLEYINGSKIEDLTKIESRKEFIHRKFKERMKEFSKKIKEKQQNAIELVKKKTLSKDDVRDLNIHLEWLTTEISSNIPFFMECFQEDMDKIVFEAKLEVENAILHKIQSVGFNVLQEQYNQSKSIKNETI